MARPRKSGLDYYPKDVDFYDDFKIIDLLNEYGPSGVTVYEVLLTLIYRNGYYLAIPLDKLASQIVRIIGNRWIPKKDFVLQVIRSCADIGLLCVDLLPQGVITSAGIQKRYAEVTARNKVDKSKYWLLEDDEFERPGDGIPKIRDNDTETGINATETAVNATEITINQIKENKSKQNESKAAARELKTVIAEYGRIRTPNEADADALLALTEQYGTHTVIDAIRTAAAKGGKSVKYVERILEDVGRQPENRHPPTHTADEIDAVMFDEWFGGEHHDEEK